MCSTHKCSLSLMSSHLVGTHLWYCSSFRHDVVEGWQHCTDHSDFGNRCPQLLLFLILGNHCPGSSHGRCAQWAEDVGLCCLFSSGLVTGFCYEQCCPCSRRACSRRALREDLPLGGVTGNAESQKNAIFPHSSIQKNSVTVAMNN